MSDPVTDPLPPPPEDLEFQARVHLMTPRVWVTPALVAINLAVFAIMLATGVHPMEPEIQDLVDWGANVGPLTIGESEWWRLGSSMFLHIGVIHVAFNMYVLWTSGPLIERLLGNVGFLGMYVISGLAGSLASLAWHPYVVSAGASGAVFGVFGALFGFLVIRRHDVPLGQLAQLRNGALVFVLFNVVFGMSKEGIDMAAHFGGLAGGFACGLILALPVTPESRRRRSLRHAILAVLGAASVAAGGMVLPQPIDLDETLERGAVIEERFEQALHAGEISEEEFLDLLETELLPAWQRVRADLESLPERIQASLPLEYVKVREQMFDLVIEVGRTGDPGATQRLEETKHRLQQIVERSDP